MVVSLRRIIGIHEGNGEGGFEPSVRYRQFGFELGVLELKPQHQESRVAIFRLTILIVRTDAESGVLLPVLGNERHLVGVDPRDRLLVIRVHVS